MRTTEGGLVTGRRAGAAGSRRHVRRRSLLHLAVAALVLAWALLLLTPLTVAAAELRQGETVVVTPTEVVDDDLYAFGQTITIHGTVTGDVIAAGQTVTISGPVEGDVLVAASQVTITGPVAGTIRTAGQVVELTATVGGDVLVAGAAVTTARREQCNHRRRGWPVDSGWRGDPHHRRAGGRRCAGPGRYAAACQRDGCAG
jgi:cytoskeletal protein CcmA (bactofilin family)